MRERTEGVTAWVVHYLHIPAVAGAAHGGTRCIKVDVVQATILRERADGVTACVVSKRLSFFWFVRTNSGLDHTQIARVVAWPTPTLLLLARSGSQRCCFEHLQVVFTHTSLAKVASTPSRTCILYSSHLAPA